jgi:hypothetical protein
MLRRLYTVLFLLFLSVSAFGQNIDGLWRGTFVMYLYNVYEVEMNLKRLPNEVFTANMKITNGHYKGEYNISGNICNKTNLEITAIFLLTENGSSNWVDCLNGTFDLSDVEQVLSFTDTWQVSQTQKGNYAACKVKFVQNDMFQCLRSAYLRKQNYTETVNAFDNLWDKYDKLKEEKSPKQEETYIVKKNEEKEPVIEIKESPFKDREVFVKNEIYVVNKTVVIEYWDRYNFDNDSISLYLNDRPILENVLLTKTKESITVNLEDGVNYLILHALNTGNEPPNTASITIKDGKKIQNVMLYSDLIKSGSLKIILNQ